VSLTALSLDELAARAELLSARAGSVRVLIGLAGAPGSGKTTVAAALTARLQQRSGSVEPIAAHVPMDGYHLADVELARLDRAGRKGAPDTFDASGYRALLHRLRTATDTVWAPAFDRTLEQPIAGSIPVEAAVRIVVSEGNYLLLDDPAWRGVRAEFDEVWFCAPDDAVRRRRLVARHERFGKSPEHASTWVRDVDERNAALVAASSSRADLRINGDVAIP
jgi:pantothenate kinase